MIGKAAVITVSDKIFRGEREDAGGQAVRAMLAGQGYEICRAVILPADAGQIRAELIKCADELGLQLVVTVGGTGFSPCDIVPEATLSAAERRVPGIPELMRAESCKVTARGCLSRAEAGIRGRTLIVNVPGSERAAKENLAAVLEPIAHVTEMLRANRPADGGERPERHGNKMPSVDAWLREAKQDPAAANVGMYLTHNGVVRATARARARFGDESAAPVAGMEFSYDRAKVEAAIAETRQLDGVFYVRVWLNEGALAVGDDIMLVLIGADIRPHAVDALQYLLGKLKSECVSEKETY